MSTSSARRERLPTPPFLQPTRESLADVLATLQEREQLRRSVAQGARLLGGGAASSQDGKGPGGWYSVAVGTHPDHVHKNRYVDIIAYDRTRVVQPESEEAASAASEASAAAYVNASLVQEPPLGIDEKALPRRWWVAAQAPIASTVHDFLSLLLSPPASPACPEGLPLINLVVQLTPLVEGRRAKCHPYFPDHVGETALVPSGRGAADRGVWVRLDSKKEKDGARESVLRVGRQGDERGRRVVHLEYLGWRDHGVPESPAHLLLFVRRVRRLNVQLASSDSADPDPSTSTEAPILLHCSAGVGRTGTFIAISSLLPLLALEAREPNKTLLSSSRSASADHPLGPYPADQVLRASEGARAPAAHDFVGATIDGLRDQRTTMAQTSEQVAWVYECLREAWRAGLYVEG